MALSIAVLVGCSTGRSYDSIADSVSYTYDHDLKQSVVKGPTEEPVYKSSAKIKKFDMDLNIKNSDTFANLDLAYSDTEPRLFSHIIDTTGQSYNFYSHEKRIVDCGVSGSSKEGICDYTDKISFQLPESSRNQYILVGRDGRNVSFNINKEYLAVMSDVTYRLKTPRADVDELRLKKDTLLTAGPTPVAKPSVQQPVKTAPVVVPAPIYTPVVSTVPVSKPIVATTTSIKQAPAGTSYIKKFEEDTTCKCSSSPQSTSTITTTKAVVYKAPVETPKVVPAKVKSLPAAKKVDNAVLSPMNKTPFCATIQYKTCATVSSCREAYDQLACGNKKLDASGKGMPCPNICNVK